MSQENKLNPMSSSESVKSEKKKSKTKEATGNTLVIVESPTKARTIRNFLPANYRVEASMGHIRDLPQSASEIPLKLKGEKWAQLGVNTETNFEPIYVIPKDKKKIVKTLQDALEDADELLLATDEDREGESISWHLVQILKPTIPVRRMVFHEITKEAIKESLTQCRDVNENLVKAQETRRILDRLVGYTLSPLLWKKIAYGLSAGRVQSVSVRLLVQRERERRAFKKSSYWDLKASLEQAAAPFEAKMIGLNGKKLANGADFDENTGLLAKGKDVILLNESQAKTLQASIEGKPWKVVSIDEKKVSKKPSPPFTTSTLQQESNRKLRLSARDTMRVAQNLYEQGWITYMRTDSVHLSNQALEASRNCVQEMYGSNYLSPEPRQYTTKAKGAQEAHEAIRPAGSTFKTPQETGLAGRELMLYDLIWKRTVASQMAEAQQTNISVQLEVQSNQSSFQSGVSDQALFRASGKRIDFPGFFRAYVEGSDDPDAAIEDKEIILPPIKVGDSPSCKSIESLGHETQPPARYTEASLVKMLENEGIGRPSTYASIIGTIADRGYAQLVGNTLIPTFTAFAVTALLEKYFPDLVDTSFTAKMERILDDVAAGEAEWLPYLKDFYSGGKGLENQVKERDSAIDPQEARSIILEDLSSGAVHIGRYGAYLEVEKDGNPVKANIPKDLTPADLSPDKIEYLLKQKIEGPEKLGVHPETGESIFVLLGIYGPYVQLGEITEETPKPKRASLPKGVAPEQATMEMAVGLLALPRTLGTDPASGGRIQANLGRFGPYVVCDRGKDGKDYRSLKAGDDVTTIELERALEILAEPKVGRGSRSTTPIKEFGNRPETEDMIGVYTGPYGHYIKCGKVNAGLPKDFNIEELTLEKALEMIKEKEASAPAKKGGFRKANKANSKAEIKSAKPKSKASTKTKATTKTKAKKEEAQEKEVEVKATKPRIIKKLVSTTP